MQLNILVTGATGFVGANVVRVLLEKGHNVKALVRPTSNRRNIEGLPIEVCIGDLQDAKSVSKAVAGAEQVYHVGAEYNFWSLDPGAMYKSNILGTSNILEAALKHKVKKVVYTSTVGAIGLADEPQPCNEVTPMDPDQLTSHYKRSKFEAEKVALSYVSRGVPLVVVNPSAPLGPWDQKPTPTGKIIVDFMQGKMPAYLDTGLNLIHVHDVAIGHVLAAERGKIGERYILGNQNMTLGEILGLLAKITGRQSPRFKIPYQVAWAAGLVSTKVSDWITKSPPLVAFEAVKMAKRYMYFDSSKAIRELGLPQTPVERALKDAVEWFSQNRYFDHKRGYATSRDRAQVV